MALYLPNLPTFLHSKMFSHTYGSNYIQAHNYYRVQYVLVNIIKKRKATSLKNKTMEYLMHGTHILNPKINTYVLISNLTSEY